MVTFGGGLARGHLHICPVWLAARGVYMTGIYPRGPLLGASSYVLLCKISVKLDNP